MTLDELIKFHEWQYMTAVDRDASDGIAVYAQTLSALHELARARKQLEFLKDKIDGLEDHPDSELSFDKVVFDGYDDGGIPVCERGEIQAWAREMLKELETIG